MPAIVTSNIEFDTSRGYVIDLNELFRAFPHIKAEKEAGLYLVELRNEQNKLVRRFKPFKKLQLETGQYWQERVKVWTPCLLIPENIASEFNIGKNYKVTIIIIKYNGKVFLPLEIKGVGYEVQKALEYLSKIEADLLSLTLEQPALNEASSYLWDAHFRLEENDIEGARTAARNSLSILQDKFLSKVIVPENSEEAEGFLNKLRKLTTAIKGFVHYGGPHPGPAPRTTTEMTISLIIELVRYLAKALERGLIAEGEPK
ncbi:hypothetical protein ES703_10069 [subsurface metagenome]